MVSSSRFLFAGAAWLSVAVAGAQTGSSLSGGPLRPEQAVYDVQSYDISLTVDPVAQAISGTTVMVAKTVSPTNVILLDLDDPYTVSQVTDGDGNPLRFERASGTIRVWFPMMKQPGQEIKTSVAYSGKPRVAKNAPWDGGFVWAKTGSGAPWVSVALEGEGADLLFPVKDHPSDKASLVTMRLNVPDPLVAVGPGRLQGVKKEGQGRSTYVWRMSQPIPNYSIVFNAAPYKLVEKRVKSSGGQNMPLHFYVLPEDAEKAPKLIAETEKYLAFFEKYLGPYPFRTEKLGIVETPYLGMEHSTAIAYGNKFRFEPDGFDWLMFHEFGHEWWANLVTAGDWKDYWIHEGFQTFMDTLYQEKTHGKAVYLSEMRQRATHLNNVRALAPRESRFEHEMYMLPPDYKKDDGDIYDKGAVVLNSLRYLIGDPAFFRALRRMAYPTKAMESVTNGSQVRFATTDDFLTIAERESGMKLGWFFDVYVRQPKLPRLIQEVSGNTLTLRWETPDGLPFTMPVEVIVDGKPRRVEMPGGTATVTFTGEKPVVDPSGWVLRGK